jgi:hypothetical protein
MWIVEADSPYQTGRCFLQDKDGKLNWIVVVKGTYDVLPDGSVALSKEQEPVHTVPMYKGEEDKSSLLYDTDLVLDKPLTDVLVNGSAYAPGKGPVGEIDVTLKVGPLQKTLRVTGDRTWSKGLFKLTRTRPEPFEKKEIIYEHAYGGSYPDPDHPGKMICYGGNPLGIGFVRKDKDRIGTPVPNIESPLGRTLDVAGFGAVPCQWEPRFGLAGTYDEAWMNDRMPFLPDDYDPLFNQCAPLDQQVRRLTGGEPVELLHMTPKGILSFNLPRDGFSCVTQFADGEVTHLPVINTVIFEPDQPRVVVVWHTRIECRGKEDHLKKTTIETTHG